MRPLARSNGHSTHRRQQQQRLTCCMTKLSLAILCYAKTKHIDKDENILNRWGREETQHKTLKIGMWPKFYIMCVFYRAWFWFDEDVSKIKGKHEKNWHNDDGTQLIQFVERKKKHTEIIFKEIIQFKSKKYIVQERTASCFSLLRCSTLPFLRGVNFVHKHTQFWAL